MVELRSFHRSNWGAYMLRLFLAGLIAVCCSVIALAQDKTQKPATPNLLKTWPANGVWQVDLVRLVDNSLGCRLVTIHDDKKTGELYLWGIRWRKEGLGATISDSKQEAVAGPSIKIVIDQVPFGTYQVGRRTNSENGANVVADFSQSEGDRFLSNMGVGGTMQFITGASTYSASLKGAQQALSDFRACMAEAGRRNTGSPAPNSNPTKK